MKLNTKQFIKKKLREIRKEVGAKRALVATSGGVDSMTCALLAHKALGRRATILFIDDGLMRADDEVKAKNALKPFGIRLKTLNAQRDFFKALKSKDDPEVKRKAFRKTVRDGFLGCLIVGDWIIALSNQLCSPPLFELAILSSFRVKIP